MYKIGFTFVVAKNGNVGVIDGVSTTGVYSVCFFENDVMYLRADVYEGTIYNNLKYGYYIQGGAQQ